MMYALLRKILFQFSTESVHHFAMDSLRVAGGVPPMRGALRSAYRSEHPVTAFGLAFRNPVGLGAGFDKNGRYLSELDILGFGFVEVGTVTPRPQPGNDRPRLFRLPQDHALINRMGFNNEGAAAAAGRIRAWRSRTGTSVGAARTGATPSALVIGGNIGKNKDTPNDNASDDYVRCFRELQDCVDYFVVNVSSPNTPGLRALQEKDALRRILSEVQAINNGHPLLLKIAPDLTESQLDDIIDLARETRLDGLVATNTTISREGLTTPATTVANIGAGGLSGGPLKQRSTDVIHHIHTHAPSLPIIGSGGIFTAADAREKFAAGATLVQVWTGFIYEGPGIVKNICKEL
ncbi:MAG TPA: quinone-dependent dihydroorotate dehydrogenase [Dinghuibacter sp.]|uniref:quinone-dependent dihydroorotate dehydrogenase n=1 Tax=Dinghuibacter sp. TaxID=2024697 RepID=UPI002B57CF10|nr:quinone-dependent dihydroorotate dehydrogenase [Dinghuibacter sp.]HTJ14892.1 quinone-dependent dihydroorotate dehydrogenase [Dinghuibacter sp.]